MCRLLGHRFLNLFYGTTCTRCGINMALLTNVRQNLTETDH